MENRIQYKTNDKLRRITFLVGIIVLITLTMLFRITSWDIDITALFYNPSLPLGDRFFLSDVEPWEFLHENDATIVAITILISFLFMIIGIVRKDKRDLLKYGFFMFMVVAIGPGLVVNVIFKDNWGRVRPSSTLLFGGLDPFYRVWDPAFLDGIHGGSFPAGHPCSGLAAIAVFFALNHPEYFVKYLGDFKPWKVQMLKFFKYFFLMFSIIVGFFMGLGRIIQGAHFASDVLWAFGFVYLTAALLYYVVFNIPKWEKSRIAN